MSVELISKLTQAQHYLKEGQYYYNNIVCIFFLQVLNSGWLNRRVASTSMNRESSRSHAVFTVALESKVGEFNISYTYNRLVLSLAPVTW